MSSFTGHHERRKYTVESLLPRGEKYRACPECNEGMRVTCQKPFVPPHLRPLPRWGEEICKRLFSKESFTLITMSTAKDENVIPALEPESRKLCRGLDSRLRGNDNKHLFSKK